MRSLAAAAYNDMVAEVVRLRNALTAIATGTVEPVHMTVTMMRIVAQDALDGKP